MWTRSTPIKSERKTKQKEKKRNTFAPPRVQVFGGKMESGRGGDGPAIRALVASSLFKLTNVYLWDDGDDGDVVVSTKTESRQDCPELSSNNPDLATDFGLVPEDVKLPEQMNALGLPLSFRSNKETKAKMCKSKRKGLRLKHSLSLEKVVDEAELLAKASEVEVVSPIALHDKANGFLSCLSMTGQSEQSYCDISVEVGECPYSTVDDFSNSNKVLCDAAIRQIHDIPCDDMSNNGQGWESVPVDVASKDDNGEGITSCNSETLLPTVCHLRDGDADHSEKELNEITMEYDGLDHCSDNGGNFCKGVEQADVSEISLSEVSEMLDVVDSPNHDADIGDWRVFWDPFYMGNYFDNLKTDASTWILPPGIEHEALDHLMDEINTMVARVVAEAMGIDDCPSTSFGFLSYPESFEEQSSGGGLVDQFIEAVGGIVVGKDNSTPCIASSKGNDRLGHGHEIPTIELSGDDDSIPPSEVLNIGSVITEKTIEDGDMEIESDSSTMQEFDTQLGLGMTKRKKKARKTRKKSYKDHKELQFRGMVEENFVNIAKYWHQRYLLFSRYDDGIKMDEEGWFSVTPEAIAKHHAERCANNVVIDCFAGVGGNSIQFAQRCKHVTAIDIDPNKIDYAYHNAAIYGVNEQIDFVEGDFFALAPRLKADIVFLSPPWGGPDYAKVKVYDIKTMLKPHDGYFLFDVAKKIASRVIMFLPKNIDLNQLAELSLSSSPPWSLEVEKNYLNGKLKAITAYFSDATHK